ncbi:hypothetical protein [Micromonospora sediminicola]|uniref:hypothetical protein n=1 Tax=Micromonospora sediminicola TaxID=946078 RepID=UPI0037BCDB58
MTNLVVRLDRGKGRRPLFLRVQRADVLPNDRVQLTGPQLTGDGTPLNRVCVILALRDLPDAVIHPAWPTTPTRARAPRPRTPVEEAPMTRPGHSWYLEDPDDELITIDLAGFTPTELYDLATAASRGASEPGTGDRPSDLLGLIAASADRIRYKRGQG